MSQNAPGPIDPKTTTGTKLAEILNNWNDSLLTSHWGGIRPAYAKAGTLWVNASAAPACVLNLFDGTQDIPILAFDSNTHTGSGGSGAINSLFTTPPVPWDVAATYPAGTVVTNAGGTFVAKDAVPAGTVPAVGPHWDVIDLGKMAQDIALLHASAGTDMQYRGDFIPGDAYVVGDLVRTMDAMWVCIANPTDPNAQPAAPSWEKFTGGSSGTVALDSLSDVVAPANTPVGKILGTTAPGVWGPIDPPAGGGAAPPSLILPADITYYVDKTAGADTNDGLTAGTAFATIKHGLAEIAKTPLTGVFTPTLQIADGDYTAEGDLAAPACLNAASSYGPTLIGNTSDNTKVKVKGIIFNGYGQVTDLELDTLNTYNSGDVYCTNCRIKQSVYADKGSIYLDNPTFCSPGTATKPQDGGATTYGQLWVTGVVTFEGNPEYTVNGLWYAAPPGVVNLYGVTSFVGNFTGKQFTVDPNGSLILDPATTIASLPGSIPGVIAPEGYVTGMPVAGGGGGQMLGAAPVKAIFFNAQHIVENLTLPTGQNGLSAGPIVVDDGFSVTVEPGAVWTVV